MSQSVPLILICDDDPVVHESLALYLDNDNFSHALTYLPTKEELRKEIETQKELFRLQQAEKEQAESPLN